MSFGAAVKRVERRLAGQVEAARRHGARAATGALKAGVKAAARLAAALPGAPPAAGVAEAAGAALVVVVLLHEARWPTWRVWAEWEALQGGAVAVYCHLKAGVALPGTPEGGAIGARLLRTRKPSERGELSLAGVCVRVRRRGSRAAALACRPSPCSASAAAHPHLPACQNATPLPHAHAEAMLDAAAEAIADKQPRAAHVAFASGLCVPIARADGATLPPPFASFFAPLGVGAGALQGARAALEGALEAAGGGAAADAAAWADSLQLYHRWCILAGERDGLNWGEACFEIA